MAAATHPASCTSTPSTRTCDRIGSEVGVGTSQTVDAGFGSIWVLTDRTLYRVHPGTDEIEPFLVLPLASGIATYALALDDQIWVADSDGTIVRMDPSTEAREQAETGLNVGGMAATENGLVGGRHRPGRADPGSTAIAPPDRGPRSRSGARSTS